MLQRMVDTLWVATRGAEPLLTKMAVPFAAAFGGAAVGAFVNWLFNKDIAVRNESTVLSAQRHAYMLASLGTINRNLAEASYDILYLKALAAGARTYPETSHIKEIVRKSAQGQLSEDGIERVTNEVALQIYSNEVENVASRIEAKTGLAMKEALSAPQLVGAPLNTVLARLKSVDAAVRSGRELGLSTRRGAPQLEPGAVAPRASANDVDTALTDAASNLMALTAQLWGLLDKPHSSSKKAG